jgi:hypothetical protein
LKERQFLTATVSPIKYHKEIQQLLQAVFLPKATAVIHCRRHQKGTDEVSEGNQKADKEAKRPAQSKTTNSDL